MHSKILEGITFERIIGFFIVSGVFFIVFFGMFSLHSESKHKHELNIKKLELLSLGAQAALFERRWLSKLGRYPNVRG